MKLVVPGVSPESETTYSSTQLQAEQKAAAQYSCGSVAARYLSQSHPEASVVMKAEAKA